MATSNFGSRTETAVAAGSDARNLLKATLTRRWRYSTIYVGLFLLIVWGFMYIPSYWARTRVALATTTANQRVPVTEYTGLPLPLPADVVLPIIATCESGGRQADADGNLIVNPDSGAIGKYQILPAHEERAKDLGYDIRTEAGNEAFARTLYAAQWTTPWEKSRQCWESKVIAQTSKTRGAYFRQISINKSWSEDIRLPVGLRVDWRTPGAAVTYEIGTADGKVTVFPAAAKTPIEMTSLLYPWFKFRTVDVDTAKVVVSIYRQ